MAKVESHHFLSTGVCILMSTGGRVCDAPGTRAVRDRDMS